MPAKMSTANIITLSRVPLLLAAVMLLYFPRPWARFTALSFLIILYVMDWLDGYVARFKNEVTDLGSVLDIAIDRVVENVLWIVFAHQGLIPVWIPILYIIRSFVVDGLRGYALAARGQSAFGMMHSRWGRFLVAGRFMRAFYGIVKTMAFGLLALVSTINAMGPEAIRTFSWVYRLEFFFVYAAAALCVVRGVPVLLDIRTLLEETQSQAGGL